MNQHEVKRFLQTAIECSVYISPLDPGLTHELAEVGTRVGLQRGEINDALGGHTHYFPNSRRLSPDQQTTALWGFFIHREDPDYRSPEAYDFVYKTLNDIIRSEGQATARVSRDVLVERGVASGLARTDVEVAITILALCGQIEVKGDTVQPTRGHRYEQVPSDNLKSSGASRSVSKPDRAKAYPIVQDVIARRSDGRSKTSEPLDAFGGELVTLGLSQFRSWWLMTVAELRRGDDQLTPIMVNVLSAALAEASLTFIVRHAQTLQLGLFQSSDYARDPRTWKVDDLLKSASTSGPNTIIDQQLRVRVEALLRTRQRIHAGRMLSEYPGGVPDIRPEEARDARRTCELVVRGVLDWLEKHQSS